VPFVHAGKERHTVKRLSPLIAVSSLAAAAVAGAQVSPADPPPGVTPQTQGPIAPPSRPSAATSSEDGKSERQALLMKHCMTQVHGAQPGMSEKDAKDFCDKQVNRNPSPQRD
jgi:hypothetical protein